MVEDDPVIDGYERLMRALAALDSGLLAHPSCPLVRARWGISALPGLRVHPEPRKDVTTAAEQAADECDLFGSRSRRSISYEGNPKSPGLLFANTLELSPAGVHEAARILELGIETRDTLPRLEDGLLECL